MAGSDDIWFDSDSQLGRKGTRDEELALEKLMVADDNIVCSSAAAAVKATEGRRIELILLRFSHHQRTILYWRSTGRSITFPNRKVSHKA